MNPPEENYLFQKAYSFYLDILIITEHISLVKIICASPCFKIS